jgi:hypothetical protein
MNLATLPNNDYTICLHAIVHAMTQGERAVHKGVGCVYRGPQGYDQPPLKCAAGYFIPDELYQDWMEATSVGFLPETIQHEVRARDLDPALSAKLLALSAWLEKHRDVLRELQAAHDTASNAADWAARTITFTTRHCNVPAATVLADAQALKEKLHAQPA